MTTLAEIRERWAEVRVSERFVLGDPDAFWMQYAALHDLLDAIPDDAEIVTPDSLARALHMNGVGCVGRDAAPRHLTRVAAVLAAIAAEVAMEESDVTHADAPSPLRAEGAPDEGARVG
jgi:hypothetical protein